MVIPQHLVDQILELNTHHPNLLVIQESARAVVQPILAKSCAEPNLEFSNPSFMHIQDILFIFRIYFHLQLFLFDIERSQFSVVDFEEVDHFIEEGDTADDGVQEVVVSLLQVLIGQILLVFAAVDQVQLIVALSVSSVGRPGQELNSLFNILSDAETLVIEDSHPVNTYHVVLLCTHHVILGCLVSGLFSCFFEFWVLAVHIVAR